MYGMDAPKHLAANVDLAVMAADAFGLNLKDLTQTLYYDLDKTGLDYKVFTSDPTDPHAIIEGYKFPLGRNYFMIDTTRVMLPSVTIYAPMTGKLYVSIEAIKKII